MAKFELSINVKYLPEWGVWEGVRELIQNGKDAEVEFNAPLTVDWRQGVLRIENEGAHLSREALLFGTTSKMGRADLIGKFGEGLKLGVLALIRAGRPVTIRSGSEVWNPTIARSEKYNADVLIFDIMGNREDKNRVRVEIGGVIESEWLEFRSRFLFLKDKRESDKETVVTEEGSLLLHKKYAGKVYNKGIFVMNDTKLIYGYDLPSVELDRDRKMVNHGNLTETTAKVWGVAVKQRPDLFDDYFDMCLRIDAPHDVEAANHYSLEYDVESKIAARFKKQFGEDAVPVRTTAESEEVAHFGVKGVVVSKQMLALLEYKIGDADKVKHKFAKSTTKIYSVDELTKAENAVLFQAYRLLCAGFERAAEDFAARVNVVDFRDETLAGLHRSDAGYSFSTWTTARIEVARKKLTDVPSALAVLVHEFAHDKGSDGSKQHVSAIEQAWERITRYLLNGGQS